MDFAEEIKEFLIESNENLASLDREIVELEQNPENVELVASAFRTIHTIKGTSGFFGFNILGSLTHITENLLSDVREGRQKLTPAIISLVLESVDEVKRILDTVEASGEEGEDGTADLRCRLERSLASAKAGAAVIDTPLESRPENALAPALTTAAKDKDILADEPAVHPPVVHAPAVHPPIKATTSVPIHGASTETVLDSTREPGGQVADSTIRVDVALLNTLMNLVGELVLARNQLLQEAPQQSTSLQQTSQRLNLITSELQEGVMKTRMQPIGVIWGKLPRVVRDLSAQCNKKIRLEMEGAGTELDKTIIEAIKDPLTHIVRNCCDHGIELPAVRIARNKKAEGLIQLRAFHEGGVVNIEISDDGGGIDAERVKAKAVERGIMRAERASQMSNRDALNLIFMPGFSTAEQVTSISGRGVGMDVVKSNIERIGGNVEVLAGPIAGTIIRIKIPLTLAIIPGLVVTLNDDFQPDSPDEAHERYIAHPTGQRWRPEERFIIPQANLLELVRIDTGEQSRRIETVHGTPILRHRSELLPLIYLGRVLGRTESPTVIRDAINIVVLQVENRKIGLVVDRICDTQEIVVKPLGRQLKGLSCYVGATIMGDGRPALILDVAGLARLAGLAAQSRAAVQEEPQKAARGTESQMLLLFRTANFARIAVPLALVDRLEEIKTYHIEHAAGRPVLHYRGEILPLVTLDEFLTPGHESQPNASGKSHVIVFSDKGRRMGLLADQILDIVDEVITAPRGANVPGLLGSAIIGGRITDLLDLHALLSASGESWLKGDGREMAGSRRVLLLEPSRIAREMVHGLLGIQGYTTFCVQTVSEALHELHQQPIDLVLMAMDIGGTDGGATLVKTMKSEEKLKHIPVIGLLPEQPVRGRSLSSEAYDACIGRTNREELKATIHALISCGTTTAEVVCL